MKYSVLIFYGNLFVSMCITCIRDSRVLRITQDFHLYITPEISGNTGMSQVPIWYDLQALL